MRFVRWSALAAVLAGTAVLGPSAGAGVPPPPVPYTCDETTDPAVGVPQLSADLTIVASASADPAKVFQPVTWTADIELPDIQPPIRVLLDVLRIRIPIPAGLTDVRAVAVAAPGETPNPALTNLTVQVTAEEVIVQLPKTPGSANWILAKPASEGGGLFYPASFVGDGAPMVPPVIEITARPTPAAAESTLDWSAPEIDTSLTYLGNPATVTCAPDGTPDPVIVSTGVGSTRQLCDGQPVTVQLGFNAPTAGADVIQGTTAADTTNGLGGNDRFCGLNGVDTFNGGGGADRALGGAGNDRLRGDAGNDRLQGDAGDDNLQGGANNDTLVGGANRDTCNGGPQNDTATTCEVRQSIP